MGFVLKSFSAERCKRVIKRERKRKGILLDFAKKCWLSKRLPLGSYTATIIRSLVGCTNRWKRTLFFESAFGRLSCNMQNQFSSTMSQFTAIIEPAFRVSPMIQTSIFIVLYHIIFLFFNSSILINAKYLNSQ